MRRTHHHATHHAASPPVLDLDDRIRTRAYQLYVERNGAAGHDLDDWLRAEQEVRTAVQPPKAGDH